MHVLGKSELLGLFSMNRLWRISLKVHNTLYYNIIIVTPSVPYPDFEYAFTLFFQTVLP